MALRINSNVDAMAAHRHLAQTFDKLSESMERLSSGLRINKAADDAGLGISEKIGGLAQARRTIQDGVSMVQTAEGNLDEVHSILQRVRELAVQYKNGSLSQSGKDAIQNEVDQLASEIDRIGTSAQFNGISLLDGTSGGVTFQVGANDGDTLTITFDSLTDQLPAGWSDVSIAGLSTIDAAIDAISSFRSGFGAIQNRLDHALSVTAVYQENLTSAESRIRDVDMAELTKNQILHQAGTAMLAQANQAPQAVLSLLRQ